MERPLARPTAFEVLEQANDINSLFNDDLFAELQATVDANNLREAAHDALSGILTLETAAGQPLRSLQDIKHETEAFFSNTAIQEIEGLFDQLAAQYAQFCDHNHEAAETLNQDGLSAVRNHGNQQLHGQQHHTLRRGDIVDHNGYRRHSKDKKKPSSRTTSLAAWLINHYASRRTKRTS